MSGLPNNSEENKIEPKTASVTLTIDVRNVEDLLGNAILHQLTNNKNTKHIVHKSHNFILDQCTEIEMVPSIYAVLRDPLSRDDIGTSGQIVQIIEVFSRVKTLPELRRYLIKITDEYEIEMKNKIGNKIYYFGIVPVDAPVIAQGGQRDYSKLPPNFTFTMKEFHTNRNFTNLFGPEIELVRKRVNFFLNNKTWYAEKGIPYTLGVLLSGEAGSGKTSTIKCLAHETNRHIININLNNDITKTQLDNLFFNETLTIINHQTKRTETFYIPLDKRIYVLEDIDCQTDVVFDRSQIEPNQLKTTSASRLRTMVDETRCEDATRDKVDLSFLLNLFDGVLETPGRIMVMTSNYPEKLDQALIRPGRVDVTAKFKKCSRVTVIEMVEFFYNINLTENEKTKIMSVREHFISPAELGKLMFEEIDDYNMLISRLLEVSADYYS